jgi:hypothetical protein
MHRISVLGDCDVDIYEVYSSSIVEIGKASGQSGYLLYLSLSKES